MLTLQSSDSEAESSKEPKYLRLPKRKRDEVRVNYNVWQETCDFNGFTKKNTADISSCKRTAVRSQLTVCHRYIDISCEIVTQNTVDISSYF